MMKFIKQLFNSRSDNSSGVLRVKPVICRECKCIIPFEHLSFKEQTTLYYSGDRIETDNILYGKECSSCIRDKKLKQLGILD